MMQGSIYNLIGLLNNIMVGRVSTVQMNGVAVVNQLMFVFYSCISGILAGSACLLLSSAEKATRRVSAILSVSS